MTNTLTVRAYVDGACRGNPGFGACGGVIYWPDGRETEWAHVEGEITTNIRMELMALTGAVYQVKKELRALNTKNTRYRVALFLFSDCQNVVQCATQQYATHANADLWQRYRAAVQDFPGTVSVQWVPRDENQRADALVAQAIDAVYEGVIA